MGPGRAFATEAATHEGADNPHVIRRNAQCLGHALAHAGDVLRRIVEHQSIAVPLRYGGVRLHRIMVLHRRGIDRVDPRFALFESGVVIAPGLVARRYAFLAGPVRILLG